MFSKVRSASTFGVHANQVQVETQLDQGLPRFFIVGLPDNAVKESMHRVIAALKNSGFKFPNRRVTINLAPADEKKEGSAYDLPIALGILLSSEQLKSAVIQDFIGPRRIGFRRHSPACSRFAGHCL